jgi:hypothetical protein
MFVGWGRPRGEVYSVHKKRRYIPCFFQLCHHVKIMRFLYTFIRLFRRCSKRVANIEKTPRAIPPTRVLIAPAQNASIASLAPGPPRPEGQNRIGEIEPGVGKVPQSMGDQGLFQQRSPGRQRSASVYLNLRKMSDQRLHDPLGHPLMKGECRTGRRMPCLVQDMFQNPVEPRQEISLFANLKQVLMMIAGKIGF